MRTLLFNNIEGRACDTPGCSERWGECKKHGTLSVGTRRPVSIRFVQEHPEGGEGSGLADLNCARCGYFVCNCARRAFPGESFDYMHPVHNVEWRDLNDTAVRVLLGFHAALVDGKRRVRTYNPDEITVRIAGEGIQFGGPVYLELGGDRISGVDSHEYGFRWSSGGPDPKNIRKDLDSGVFRAGRAQIERFNGHVKRVAGLDYEAMSRGHLSYWTDDKDIFRLWLDGMHIRLSSDTRKDHRTWGLASFDLAHAEGVLKAGGFTKVEDLETQEELRTASSNFNRAKLKHETKQYEYTTLSNFGSKVFDRNLFLLPDLV